MENSENLKKHRKLKLRKTFKNSWKIVPNNPENSENRENWENLENLQNLKNSEKTGMSRVTQNIWKSGKFRKFGKLEVLENPKNQNNSKNLEYSEYYQKLWAGKRKEKLFHGVSWTQKVQICPQIPINKNSDFQAPWQKFKHKIGSLTKKFRETEILWHIHSFEIKRFIKHHRRSVLNDG